MTNANTTIDTHAQDAATNEGMPEANALLPEAQTEPRVSRSVVPKAYKKDYAARGNAANCGDWLAKALDGYFDVLDEKGRTTGFDSDAFTGFLSDNEVQLNGKWATLPTSGQKGWIGRYRMNGRQQLEKVVLAKGSMTIGGAVVEAPEHWLLDMATKHPKVECAFRLA